VLVRHILRHRCHDVGGFVVLAGEVVALLASVAVSSRPLSRLRRPSRSRTGRVVPDVIPSCDAPNTGRIVSQLRLPQPDAPITKPVLVGGGVWVMQGRCHQPESIVRRDHANTTTASASLGRIGALAGADGNLWALGLDGTLTQVDARTGRIVHRWPGLAPLSVTLTVDAPSRNSLVADGAGVWVLSPGRGAILHIRDGGVVQQITVDPSARPVLANARDGLWIATGDLLSDHNRLIRIDPGSGKLTGLEDHVAGAT